MSVISITSRTTVPPEKLARLKEGRPRQPQLTKAQRERIKAVIRQIVYLCEIAEGD